MSAAHSPIWSWWTKVRDVCLIETPGGGGFGDPRLRDADAMARDRRDGKVSAACAERTRQPR